jgi:hypothetical protein
MMESSGVMRVTESSRRPLDRELMIKRPLRGFPKEAAIERAKALQPLAGEPSGAVGDLRGLEIIGKLADVLGVDPVEFFWGPTRSAPRKKS